jgi:hypothetical protein
MVLNPEQRSLWQAGMQKPAISPCPKTKQTLGQGKRKKENAKRKAFLPLASPVYLGFLSASKGEGGSYNGKI